MYIGEEIRRGVIVPEPIVIPAAPEPSPAPVPSAPVPSREPTPVPA